MSTIYICSFHITKGTKYCFAKMSVQVTFNEMHGKVDIAWLKLQYLQTIIPQNIFKTSLKSQFSLKKTETFFLSLKKLSVFIHQTLGLTLILLRSQVDFCYRGLFLTYDPSLQQPVYQQDLSLSPEPELCIMPAPARNLGSSVYPVQLGISQTHLSPTLPVLEKPQVLFQKNYFAL